MTDRTGGLDPAEVRDRLPDGWRVEAEVGEEVVYGCEARTGAVQTREDCDAGMRGRGRRGTAAGPPDTHREPASFRIHKRDDGLWAASWTASREAGDETAGRTERVRGTKERCIEWVAERAAESEARQYG